MIERHRHQEEIISVHKGEAVKLLTKEAEQDLKEYLEFHEDDIALGIDDFAELRSVFIVMFNRQPIHER